MKRAIERLVELATVAEHAPPLTEAERQQQHADLLALAKRTPNSEPERDLFAPGTK